VEIELPFLQAALDRFCLVPILVGDTRAEDERAFAESLTTLDDGRTLFVFSSDFAHYGPRFGYTPFGALSPETREKIREMDERAIDLLSEGNARGFRAYLRESGNTICGRHGLRTMLELLPRIAPEARSVLLAHYASFDLLGMQDENSVTYVTMAFVRGPEAPPAETPLLGLPRLDGASFDAPPVSPEAGDALVRLARAALETQLAGGNELERTLAGWPTGPEYERRQGVFVTLKRRDPDEFHQNGRMRGCFGEVDPRFPLYVETVQAAVGAALNDPRFEPVTAFDLGRIEVEVTVLSPRHPVESWRDIEVGTHGIVLEKGDNAAVFLPQVPVENGWTLPETLAALSKKAGLPEDGWEEGARLSIFTGQVFGEK
jgi:AmmeMemoRadiSam system protein A